MKNIRKYNHFLILEKFDSNIKTELIRLGITDEEELKYHIKSANKGHLAEYLKDRGTKFTFGILKAIFLDAIEARKKADLKVGVVKMAHRLIPIALAPFFPILAILGYILGTSRAFNKVIAPILADPGSDYSAFLKKIIDSTMRVMEGEIKVKDRFTRAFVVSDRLIEAIKPEIIHKFSIHLAKKMSEIEPSMEVPDHYIENELRKYLNEQFEINPEIPIKTN